MVLEPILASDAVDRGVELAGVGGEFADGEVEVAQAQVHPCGVADGDGVAEVVEGVADLAEHRTLERAGFLGGAEHEADRAQRRLAGRSEFPEFVALQVFLDRRRPERRVLHPVDALPLPELVERRTQGTVAEVVEAVGDRARFEPAADLAGAHLEVVGLFRLGEHGEDGGVERSLLRRRRPQCEQPLAFVDVERPVDQ